VTLIQFVKEFTLAFVQPKADYGIQTDQPQRYDLELVENDQTPHR